jgi:phage-related protein
MRCKPISRTRERNWLLELDGVLGAATCHRRNRRRSPRRWRCRSPSEAPVHTAKRVLIGYTSTCIRGCGDKPIAWVATATIGPGVREIRIHTDLEHRVFYAATFADAVYVLHGFEKRTRKTPKRDLDLAGDRFRALVRE